MKDKKVKGDNEMVFGRQSSRVTLSLSLLFLSIGFYLLFWSGLANNPVKQIVIGAFILFTLYIVTIFYYAHYIVVNHQEICILNNLNPKYHLRLSIETIKKMYFYLPRSSHGTSTIFYLQIHLKTQKKKIHRPIGLSKKEIRRLSDILKEKGIEMECDPKIT